MDMVYSGGMYVLTFHFCFVIFSIKGHVFGSVGKILAYCKIKVILSKLMMVLHCLMPISIVRSLMARTARNSVRIKSEKFMFSPLFR